jgi:hypothetical protein
MRSMGATRRRLPAADPGKRVSAMVRERRPREPQEQGPCEAWVRPGEGCQPPTQENR